jgi:hypothetical protein
VAPLRLRHCGRFLQEHQAGNGKGFGLGRITGKELDNVSLGVE